MSAMDLFFDWPREYTLGTLSSFGDMLNRQRVTGGGPFFARIDVMENENFLKVYAEVPGMTSDKVSLESKGNKLIFWGDNEDDMGVAPGNYLLAERRHGCFRREISMPPNADMSKAEAVCENGMLCITVPKVVPASVGKKMISISRKPAIAS